MAEWSSPVRSRLIRSGLSLTAMAILIQRKLFACILCCRASMRKTEAVWVAAAAGLEVVTGVGLVVAPSLLASLLFGSEMNASGDLVGRISGLVMLCLAFGCWPRPFEGENRQALASLLALSLLATVFLIYVGIGGVNVGVLLWPAAAAHLILAILLARTWMSRGAAG